MSAGALLLFIFFSETSYRRSSTAPRSNEQMGDESQSNVVNDDPWTIWQHLRPFRGKESYDSLLRLIFRMLPLIMLPQVAYATISGLSTSWLSNLIPLTWLYFDFSLAYSFIQVGILGVGGLAASILGFGLGSLNDWICKKMAYRNKGIYEPEVLVSLYSNLTKFRLASILGTFVLATIGWVGWVVTWQFPLPWVIPFVFECIAVVALSFLHIATFAYTMDCFPDRAAETFTALNFGYLIDFGLDALGRC